MTIVYLGRGYSLRKIMREKLHLNFTNRQKTELVSQLKDAAINAGSPKRREDYALWALEVLGNWG